MFSKPYKFSSWSDESWENIVKKHRAAQLWERLNAGEELSDADKKWLVYTLNKRGEYRNNNNIVLRILGWAIPFQNYLKRYIVKYSKYDSIPNWVHVIAFDELTFGEYVRDYLVEELAYEEEPSSCIYYTEEPKWKTLEI